MDRDTEDLRHLALAHYAVAVVTALMALPFLYGTWWGVECIQHPSGCPDWLKQPDLLDLPPETVGMMVAFAFGSLALMILLHAAIVAYVGYCVAKSRRYWLVYIFSLLDCTYVPFGTIIGIWAVVVLNRASMRVRFGLKPRPVPKARPSSSLGA